MSSHHIVRDAQEPALLLMDQEISHDEIGQLLEWSPLIVIDEKVLPRIQSWGLKIDGIIGNKEILEGLEELQSQQPCNIIHSVEENKLEAGLNFLISKNSRAVNIFLKDLFHCTNAIIPYLNQLNFVIFQDHKKIIPVKGTFEKWVTKGQKFEVINQGSNQNKTTGLSLVKIIDLGYTTEVYTANEDGSISIESPELVWVAEEL